MPIDQFVKYQNTKRVGILNGFAMIIWADKMTNRAAFANWLDSQMTKHDISQAELARRAGVTRSAINGLLNKRYDPGTDVCQGIAKALGIPADEVYRVAGLLPPAPMKNAIIDRILHEMADMTPEEKEEIHEYVKLRRRMNRRKSSK